jgi:minichromosome maintenance protein 10
VGVCLSQLFVKTCSRRSREVLLGGEPLPLFFLFSLPSPFFFYSHHGRVCVCVCVMSDDLFDIFKEDLLPPGKIAELGSAAVIPIEVGVSEAQGHPTPSVTDGLPQGLPTHNDALLGHSPSSVSTTVADHSARLAGSEYAGPTLSLENNLSFSRQGAAQGQPAASTSAVATEPPRPLPFSAPNNILISTSPGSNNNNSSSSHGGGGGAVVIIRPSLTAASNGNCGGEGIMSSLSMVPPPASAVLTEPHSRIRVRRATVAMEQLAVRLAEFPYASFSLFRQSACRGGAQTPVPHTCVGVVTRKSDPKQNTTLARASRYAILTLWNMATISPAPESEISLLLCGDAFELLYSQLVRGSVVALSNVAMCPRKGSAAAGAADLDVLLRVPDHAAVRQLGFAADLGTCVAVSRKSNERCNTVVNTQLSQHCTFHVADLRKVARGIAGDTAAAHRSGAPSTSTKAAPAILMGGTLTTHLSLTAPPSPFAVARAKAHQGNTLPPGSIAPRFGAPAAVVAAAGPSSLLSQLQPVNARLAASQQLLRQPSFFAVRGATGLPVEDAAQRRGLNSAGSGVYGGVHGGAPLLLKQKVGLRPAERYPSAQELGVTSRGRDVLEAARQQAVLREEEKLLRRSLKTTEPGKANASLNETNLQGGRKRSADSGGGKATNAKGATTRVPERDAHAGQPSGASDDAHTHKRVRTDAGRSSASSNTTTTSVPTSSPPTSSARAVAAVDAQRISALRAQFQPLHRASAAAFVPLTGHSSDHSVLPSAVQKDYRHTVVMAASGGGGDAQSAMLRAAAKAAKEMSKRQSSSGGSGLVGGASSSSTTTLARAAELVEQRHAGNGEVLPLTLLGTVASTVQSQHDHLRGEADKQRLLSFVDKQITQEKALEALAAITQQEIKAYFCYNCRCWYAKPPTTCVEQHHRTELKPALKKYIKCEHCNYKTCVIGGEDAKGWKVFPKCPRCHQTSFWIRGDAAPQVAAPTEEPAPL